MKDLDLVKLVNDLELRCPICNGNILIKDIYIDNISFKHNLYIPGEKVESDDSKCKITNNKIKQLLFSYKNGEKNHVELRDGLIAICSNR